MKATFISVENMQLKFELRKVQTDLPVLHLRSKRAHVTPPIEESEIQPALDPIRFIGHSFVFCGRTHRIYVWDLLRLDHTDVRRGLEEFLKSHFYSTPNHEEPSK